jgi:hypothetical protein
VDRKVLVVSELGEHGVVSRKAADVHELRDKAVLAQNGTTLRCEIGI